MVRPTRLLLGAVGGLVAASGIWSLYQRRTTDEPAYTVVATVGDVELRRYPPTVVAETVAADEGEAFARLFRYIGGANEGSAELAMTAPVELTGRGTKIAMTAPVEVTARGEQATGVPDDGVRMAFYLPSSYDAETAPPPTDDAVTLVAVPARTLAVRRFSWFPSERRVERETERLLAALDRADVAVEGAPFFMGYDAPWTLPFLRRNEVAVEVAAR